MGMIKTFTKSLAAANDAAVAASQTPGAPGNLTLTATPVVLDTLRQVILTFAADETGHTFVLYGTDNNGSPLSETIAGAGAGVVASVRMYKTVTQISISAAATGAIKAGTNGIGASEWIIANYQLSPFEISIGCVVTGTVNFTVEYTYDDFWTVQPGSTQGNVPTPWSLSALASKTATTDGTINDPVTGWRLKINSGTGTVAVSAMQAGLAGAQ